MPIAIQRREHCCYCGTPLTSDNALKYGDYLICDDWDCVKELISDTDYIDLCVEFAEDIYPEKFQTFVKEAFFDGRPDEDDIIYEESEPERK